jgi:SAM-dependent methyltransferase
MLLGKTLSFKNMNVSLDRKKINSRIKCPICSARATRWEAIGNGANSRAARSFIIYKCNFCGHGFIYPGVKNEQELLDHYDKDYSKGYDPEIKTKDFQLRQKQYQLSLTLIKKYLPKKNISVLDFGCSTGQFLKIMPARWKKFGFEVNKFELDYVAKHYKNITLFSKIAQVKKKKYDLIILRGVIEHLIDFKKLFSVIDHSLKKGGLVFICATPDFSSPGAALYRARWNQICPPEHYHQFTMASAAILFAKHNFGLKDLYHSYLETPYADFKKDSLKFILNTRRILEHKKPVETIHPYPGTMMSLIFEKIKK